MFKKAKKISAAVLSAVMMLTAVATPLGDNLPAVRESTSLTAGAAEISTDGYYTLKNLYAGKMLNVRGSYSTSNTNVIVYETDGTTGQQFRFIKSGSNYVLEPKCAPTCALNVYGTSASNGANVNIWTKSGNSTQAWVMEYSSSSSAYIIRSAANTNLVLTATGTSNSSNVALAYYSSGNKSQLWAAEKVSTSTPSSGGVITTQSIQAVLDKYNYKTGKYWTPKNASDSRTSGYMGSDRPSSTSYYYDNGSQCWGFANFVLHEVTGTASNPNNGNNANWEKLSPSQVTSLKIGDHVRIKYWSTKKNSWSWHSGVVLTANGDNYTFAECWGGVNNKIVIGGKLNSSYGTMSSIKSVLEFVYRYKGSHTHSYGSWYTTTSATCTSGGTEERKCSCGAVETRSTSALGHDYGSTYFEADHPHKYAHLCQRCGYKEFTGGNLAIYEKCDICYNENLPGKPSLNISSNGFNETDNVSFAWNDTEKTTHYVLTVAVLSGDEYKTVCRETYVNSGFQTTFGKGQYRALLQSYNSNMFHQYTSDWRDWVHNNSEYVYFNIDCAHEYLGEVVSPTFDREGYTQYTCTKCGDSYIDNYTEKLSLEPVTGAKLGGRAADALRVNWTKNANASGYIVEMYQGNKWVRVAKITNNNTTTFRKAGLKAGTAYKFRVKAYVLYGDTPLYSDYSATVAARTNPSVMKGAKLGGRAADALRVNWTKNASADGYIVEMYQGNKWVRVGKITNNSTTTFRKAGLKASSVYKFRVRAYKMSGKTALYGNYSATVMARTNPSVMKGVKIGGKAKDALRVNWTKNTSAQGYIVEMYKGGKWVRVAKITNNNTTTFRKAGLAKNTTYKFRVRAYHMSGKTALYGNYGSVSGRTAAK